MRIAGLEGRAEGPRSRSKISMRLCFDVLEAGIHSFPIDLNWWGLAALGSLNPAALLPFR